MTYGEYWTAVKISTEMKNGEWSVGKPLKNIPKKMNRKEASSYYGEKFNDYWLKGYYKN